MKAVITKHGRQVTTEMTLVGAVRHAFRLDALGNEGLRVKVLQV